MSPEKIELEPGVFLHPKAARVVFEKEHMSWPLPRPGISARLGTDPLFAEAGLTLSPATALAAADIIAAYEQMIWDDRDKRQHVIRCLRKGLEKLRELACEERAS